MGFKTRTTDSVTIYHNPHCSTSVHAIATAQSASVPYNEVQYLKTKPDRAELESKGHTDV